MEGFLGNRYKKTERGRGGEKEKNSFSLLFSNFLYRISLSLSLSLSPVLKKKQKKTIQSFPMIALVKSLVLAVPPKSPVLHFPSAITPSVASWILCAAAPCPTCRSIITPESISAVGLALSCPAMSGAVPCTASISASPFAPTLPEGVSPSPPMRPAQRSEMMSPYRLGMTYLVCEVEVFESGGKRLFVCVCEREREQEKRGRKEGLKEKKKVEKRLKKKKEKNVPGRRTGLGSSRAACTRCRRSSRRRRCRGTFRGPRGSTVVWWLREFFSLIERRREKREVRKTSFEREIRRSLFLFEK